MAKSITLSIAYDASNKSKSYTLPLYLISKHDFTAEPLHVKTICRTLYFVRRTVRYLSGLRNACREFFTTLLAVGVVQDNIGGKPSQVHWPNYESGIWAVRTRFPNKKRLDEEIYLEITLSLHFIPRMNFLWRWETRRCRGQQRGLIGRLDTRGEGDVNLMIFFSICNSISSSVNLVRLPFRKWILPVWQGLWIKQPPAWQTSLFTAPPESIHRPCVLASAVTVYVMVLHYTNFPVTSDNPRSYWCQFNQLHTLLMSVQSTFYPI